MAFEGVVHTFSSAARLTRRHPMPAAVSHWESSLQSRGHTAAGKQVLPAGPRSQHRSPLLELQS